MSYLCSIIIIFPIVTNAFINLENPNNIKNIHCHTGSEGFWDLYYWHYGNASTINISILLGKHSDLVNIFISKIFHYLFGQSRYRRSIFLQSFTTKRPQNNETYNIIFNDTRRSESSITKIQDYKKFNYAQNMRRLAGEPYYGFLWIAFDIEDLTIFLVNHNVLTNPRGSYVIIFLSPDEDQIEEHLERLFKVLWEKYLILNVYIKLSCSKIFPFVFRYNPFQLLDNNTKWGKLQKFIIDEDTRINELNYRNDLKKMQGYPVNISMFPRTPSAINKLPKAIRESSIYKILERSGNFGGLDGSTLAHLSYYLNFTTIIISPPANVEYGLLKNGTLVGSLGDVVYRNVVANFNGRFVLQYDSDQIEFTNPVNNDLLCLCVPKAEKIPQWLKLLKCFTFEAWISVFVLWVCVSCYWYLICQVILTANVFRRDLTDRFLEVFALFITVPFRRQIFDYRRIFCVACLFFNIIFVGTFQGSLYKSYTTVTYYPDINTLEDLDRSGLQLRITSKSLISAFGNDTNPVMKRLKQKISQVVTNSSSSSLTIVAQSRDSAAFERKNDAKIRITSDFTRKTDGFEMLHVMQECPWTYYVAYIVPLGSPYLPIFNSLQTRFLEAGLISKWTADTIEAIILEKRVHPTEDTDTLKPFTLKEMQAAFYLVSLGLIFSFCVFIGELMFYWSRRSFIKFTGKSTARNNYYDLNKRVFYPNELVYRQGVYNGKTIYH